MDYFIGEIRMFAGNFAPLHWAMCNGQLLSISQNQALFSLIGTTYGGDGIQTFALPDLRGRLPVHFGQGPGLSYYPLGMATGAESVTLTIDQIPGHTHLWGASNLPATTHLGTGQVLAVPELGTGGGSLYEPAGSADKLVDGPAGMVTSAGGSQAHDNMMPYQVVTYIMALSGIFPSRN